MRKTFILFVSFLVLSVFAFSEAKIGVINSQDLLQKTKKGSEITKKLTDWQNKKGQEIQAMQEELKKIEKDLQSPALNDETRGKKAIEMEAKRKNLTRFIEDARNEFETQSQQELGVFEKDIMPLIEDLGKTKGFSIIFDVSRAGIVYMDTTVDITDDVVKAVDAKFPK